MTDLDPAAIAVALARLGARDPDRAIHVVAVTGSTNDDARAAAARGAPHGAVFLADTQTAGRGRGGHTWHSPPGENLYLSVILRPRVPASSVAPIALAVGLAVADAIEARVPASVQVRIKWPNDVLADGRKLAGVLVEGQLRGGDVTSLVVGVGINVRTASFPPEIAARATSLALLGAAAIALDRADLAATLLAAIHVRVADFEDRRLDGMLDELGRRDALRGRRVEAFGTSGIAAGIDASGRLLVRCDGGTMVAVVSGEVTFLDDLASNAVRAASCGASSS